MSAFRRDDATNWIEFRSLQNCVEVDFHWSDGPRELAYEEAMSEVERVALDAIREAYEAGRSYVLMTHGRSTSEGWEENDGAISHPLVDAEQGRHSLYRAGEMHTARNLLRRRNSSEEAAVNRSRSRHGRRASVGPNERGPHRRGSRPRDSSLRAGVALQH